MMDTNRLTELETQVAFQDDVVQQLNAVVTTQQQQIEQLRHELRVLSEQLAALREKIISSGVEPPPPHY